MQGVVFKETLRQNWRGMVYWGIGLALLGILILSLIGDIDALKQVAQLMETLPPALIKAMGMDDMSQLATPEGFLGGGYFGRVILIMSVFGIIGGLNITANEEDQGILDVLLSLPLPRWRLIVEKFAAYTVLTTGILAIGFLGLLFGQQATAIDVRISRLLESTFNVLPSVLLIIAFTGLAGALFRRKSTATAVSAIFVIGSYFVDFIGRAASDSFINQLRVVSFFNYYDNDGVMRDGLAWGNIGLLAVITLVLVGGAVWFFQRRDVGG
ncbi:MAG: ABC transporter permease subunit [Anaerolineae bacterium]